MENDKNKYAPTIASNDRESQSVQELHMKLYRWKCNLWWMAGFVVILLALWGSFVLYNVGCDSLNVAITNFSTILSIILSISSITYAYTTSHDTARQFAEIDKTVARMRENNEDMKSNNTQMLGLVVNISKEVHALYGKIGSSATPEINNEVELPNSDVKSNMSSNEVPTKK